MNRFLFIIQQFLKFSLVFLLIFIWLKYLKLQLWLSIVLASSISIMIELLFYLLSRKKKFEKTLKIAEKDEADNMFLSLLTCKNNLDFFFNLVKSRHSEAVKKKNYIKITHQDNSKVLLIPFIELKSLSLNNIAQISKINEVEKADKIVVTCFEYDKNVLSFVKNFDFQFIVIDRYETYSLLYKEYDFYPEITLKYKKEAKLNFKNLLAFSFNKSRTKGYLLASFILLISSFFVKLNIYYCVLSSLLLLFALISFINPRYNSIKTKEII